MGKSIETLNISARNVTIIYLCCWRQVCQVFIHLLQALLKLSKAQCIIARLVSFVKQTTKKYVYTYAHINTCTKLWNILNIHTYVCMYNGIKLKRVISSLLWRKYNAYKISYKAKYQLASLPKFFLKHHALQWK